MSLDKGIQSGKEHRKEYQKSAQRVDRSTRPGGDDPWDQSNRHYGDKKRAVNAKELIDAMKDEE